jgi:hypothetical protein
VGGLDSRIRLAHPWRVLRALVLLALVVACGPKPRVEDDGRDARVEEIDASRPPPDGAMLDAAIDGAAGGLDPDLDVPPAANQACTTPGSLSDAECPGIQVCRFFSPTEGRCESCVMCGNLNAMCDASDQCDILFMCFQGRCTNFCTIGTTECGAPQDCVDIGHPTHGVCQP